MAVVGHHLADIGNIVCNDDTTTPIRAHDDSFIGNEPVSTEQEIDVELAVYAKGNALLSPMQVFEVIFSETTCDKLPEYPDCNGYYIISADEAISDDYLDLWMWTPLSNKNKLFYRCISKQNTIIAIEAFQEDAEDLTEAPKYYIQKRDRSATNPNVFTLSKHYVDSVHVYRICRKSDLHSVNSIFRRHVVWVEGIEPSLQETPPKRIVEYLWKGKAKPESLHEILPNQNKSKSSTTVTRVEGSDDIHQKRAKLVNDERTATVECTESEKESDVLHSLSFKSGLYKVHISNLDPQVSESDINDLFSEFSSMKFYSVHHTKDGVPQGSAEVHYEDSSSVEEVVKQYNGVPLDGWPLCLCLVRNAGDVPAEEVGSTHAETILTKIHISNLSPSISDDELTKVFEPIGGTKRCVVHYSSTGSPLGTGEVTFESLSLAVSAVRQFDRSSLDGWPLRLALLNKPGEL